MYNVDLNSDLGESFGAYTIGMDSEVLKYISSANIACGFHAGDPVVMEKTVALACENGVAIGAHPGYPDMMGFGRRSMTISPAEAKAYTKYQVGALAAFAKARGMKLQHCKPHGAFYNAAAVNLELATAICQGIREVDPEIILLGLAGSKHLEAARLVGLRCASEVYADRAYMDDGTLVPRKQQGAVIHDASVSIARVVRMVKEGTVESITGKTIEIKADSICVHGDNPKAIEFVSAIRAELQAQGVKIVPIGSII